MMYLISKYGIVQKYPENENEDRRLIPLKNSLLFRSKSKREGEVLQEFVEYITNGDN